MDKKYYYIVNKWTTFWDHADIAIYDTYAEAVRKIKLTKDAFGDKGRGVIKRVDCNLKIMEYWSFEDNKLTEHYCEEKE